MGGSARLVDSLYGVQDRQVVSIGFIIPCHPESLGLEEKVMTGEDENICPDLRSTFASLVVLALDRDGNGVQFSEILSIAHDLRLHSN